MAIARRVAVELREDPERRGPGVLSAVVMRYGSAGEGGRELFAPGSLRWPDNGIRIDVEHASAPRRGRVAPPLMRAVPFVTEAGEVRIEAPLPDTTAARDVAALLRASPPAWDGMSVEFEAGREHRDLNGRRVIDEALLRGAALTEAPSYEGTRVEVRRRGGLGRRVWL